MASYEQIIAIINRIGPYAQKYAQKYGYHVASPCIAQALQESLGKYEGLSLLAYEYHNYHGIKAYPKWTGKRVNLSTGEEYTAGTITKVNSLFCVFDSEEDGIEQYFIFLEKNARYRSLKNCVTPEDYIHTIKNCGYCTSSSYVNNCIGKIQAYNLKAFDNFTYCPATATTYTIGKIYTLQSNMYVRSEPFGDKVKFECITQDAKRHAHFDDYGCAVLEKGTKVTCLALSDQSDSEWMLIPSGWVCARSGSGKSYIL